MPKLAFARYGGWFSTFNGVLSPPSSCRLDRVSRDTSLPLFVGGCGKEQDPPPPSCVVRCRPGPIDSYCFRQPPQGKGVGPLSLFTTTPELSILVPSLFSKGLFHASALLGIFLLARAFVTKMGNSSRDLSHQT